MMSNEKMMFKKKDSRAPHDTVGSTWMTMSGNHEDVPPHLFAAASDGEASSNINPAAMW